MTWRRPRPRLFTGGNLTSLFRKPRPGGQASPWLGYRACPHQDTGHASDLRPFTAHGRRLRWLGGESAFHDLQVAHSAPMRFGRLGSNRPQSRYHGP